MKFSTFDRSFRRLASIIVAAGMAAALIPGHVAQAANKIEEVMTPYVPTDNERIDISGFKHPGLGYTKEMLENVQTQVRAQQQPWTDYFNDVAGYGSSSKTPTVKNTGNGTTPRFLGLASQGTNDTFIADASVVYGQAVMYLITGDDTYRANGMRIIRIYAQMDPARYAYFVDSHIHTGIPLQRMLAGAEILRHTSTRTPALEWTDDDTTKFTTNLVIPVMQTFNSCNCRFMNQHLYSTIANMSGAIFSGNREEYNKAVEWFTVNKDAVDQGQTGSIKQLFRLVTRNDNTGEPVPPQVQHVEMGRDQAHGGGDITNANMLARMMNAQGTKVDPVTGTASTEPNAVGPYEFLDDRIFAAAEIFSTFMVGHEIPWVPTASHTDPEGNPTVVYQGVSGAVRGRGSMALWDVFYYYKYVRGFDMAQRAPNLTKYFSKRTYNNWGGHDGGGDYWIGIPKEAVAEGNQYQVLPGVHPYREVEQRFTPLDGNSVAMQDETASFVRVTATPEGSKVVFFSLGAGGGQYAIRFRTNGIVKANLPWRTLSVLPDTHGEWRHLIVPQDSADYQDYTFTGAGTTLDIDHLNVGVSTSLSPPAFTSGAGALTLYSYAGATQATTFDFSATDPAAADVITYEGGDLPQGASINPATGAFSWNPTQAGTYSFHVSASDGTTVTLKFVTVIVDADRQGAVNTASARYNPSTLYVVSSLPQYNSAYADMMSVVGSGSDEAFFQKLTALRSASAALQELTPLLNDGSIDYGALLYSSSLGAKTNDLTDDIGWTHFGIFKNDPRVIKFDFGPNFKVAANRFDLTAVPSFPERGYGSAIFASNDNETWTRLTPGLSVRVDAAQTLPMTDDVLKNTRFRFFEIRMLDRIGDVPLQPSEFRIFGTRYETINKVETVSLSSAQALKNGVVAGNTIELSFVSTEAINDVTATIQGMPATVTTTDNLNWTAKALVDGTTAGGRVKFLVKYKTQEGVDAEPVFMTTDKTGLIVQESRNYLDNLPQITAMSNSAYEGLSALTNAINALSDRNPWSISQFRLNGSGVGAWMAFDFRAGGTVNLSRVEVLATQNNYYTRISGAVVQGSNDNLTWTTISNGAYSTMDWQTLNINNWTPFRYVRIYNPNNWLGNMSELRMYGVAVSINKIATTSIGSAQAVGKRVVAGDTVKLSFTAKEAISNVAATIAGTAAMVSTEDNISYTATAILPQDAAVGPVTFAINYQTAAGAHGFAVSETTDGTALSVADNSGYINNLLALATVTDSGKLSPSAVLAMANKLFDGNLTTISDFRVSGSGVGSWVAFDFRGGGTVNLSRVDVIGNQANTAIRGAVVQGSNDYANWTTISDAAIGSKEWQTLAISDATPYRYVRMVNPNSWYGNMAELRLFGTSASSNGIASASLSSAQALRNRIVPGNAVKLSFTAKEAISDVTATIQGVPATVSTTDNISFTATATLPQGVTTGAVNFAINYKDQSGQSGYSSNATTDGTALNLVDESDVIKNFGAIATLIDSTANRSAAATLTIVNTLLDGNLITGSDFRNGSSAGSGAYIAFDFKEGNQVNLTNVEVIGSQDGYSSRMAGVVIQGSNDGASWTTLTAAASNTQEWQNLKVASPAPYRYVRIYNGAAWYGTMREVRLHGAVRPAGVAALATSDNAPSAWVNADTTVALTTSDPSRVAATYYTVDGGAQQTGNAVALSSEGNHALVYWSVDLAGNVEPRHTVNVKIDKTAPATTATPGSAPVNGWHNGTVALTLSANSDTGSGLASSYYTVDGGEQQAGNKITVSATGMHTVTYWSVDQAGNVEQPQSVAVNIGPFDVSASVKLEQYGASFNRATGKFVGSVTVTNTSGATLTGPLHLRLNGLSSGITLDNTSGGSGTRYVTLSGPLNPGASVNLPLTFTNPSRIAVIYTPALYQGNF